VKNITKIILIAFIAILALASSVSAVSYSDEDGDGTCETGEVITFEGDEYYMDSNGNIHYYQEWMWDFNGDGEVDAFGRVVTHTFESEGTHVVTLFQRNGNKEIIEIQIEVESDDDDHECKDYYHIVKFMEKHPENKNKLDWILKKIEKLEDGKCDCL
jgi:hypothetical protein